VILLLIYRSYVNNLRINITCAQRQAYDSSRSECTGNSVPKGRNSSAVLADGEDDKSMPYGMRATAALVKPMRETLREEAFWYMGHVEHEADQIGDQRRPDGVDKHDHLS